MNPKSELRRAKWRARWNDFMRQGFVFWRDALGEKPVRYTKPYDAYVGKKAGFAHAPYRKAMID